MRHRFFNPYIGLGIQVDPSRVVKVLVVGASFYCDRTQCHHYRRCTSVQIKDSSPFDTDCPFSNGIPLSDEPESELFSGNRTYSTFANTVIRNCGLEMSRDEFISSISFTNYVQFLLPHEDKGTAGKTTMRDLLALSEVIGMVCPDIVIIWGSEASADLKAEALDPVDLKLTAGYFFHIEVDGREIPVFNCCHPADRFRFFGKENTDAMRTNLAPFFSAETQQNDMKEIERQKSLLEECFQRNGIACDRIICRDSGTYTRMRVDLSPGVPVADVVLILPDMRDAVGTCRTVVEGSRLYIDIPKRKVTGTTFPVADARGHLPVGLGFGSRPVYAGESLLVLGDPETGKSTLLKSMMHAVPEATQRIHICTEKDAEEGSVTGRGAASERLASLAGEVLRRNASKDHGPVVDVFIDDADLLVGRDGPDMQMARDMVTVVKDGPRVGVRTYVSISSLDWSLTQLLIFNSLDVFSFHQKDPSLFFSDYVSGLIPHEGLFFKGKALKTYVRVVQDTEKQ